MEIHTPPLVKNMKRLARFEPVITDHSSVIQFKTCPKKYFFRIILGFVPRETPQYFGFGSCYHKFREVLELEFMKANELWKAYQKSDKSTPPPDNPMLEDVQMKFFGAGIEAARVVWRKKNMTDPVIGDKWDFLTFGRLLASCAKAFEHWKKEKQRGIIEVIAVEQNFIVPLPDGTPRAGKADQIVRRNGKPWGRDFKTSSKTQDHYYNRTLDPNDQFTGYTWAESQLCGETVGGQLVEVLFNAKSTKKEEKGPEIFIHEAGRAPSQIARWVEEQMFINKMLDMCRKEDTYPMFEKSCPFCEFHSVCKTPGEQSQMAKLQAEFKVEPWDCTARTDVDD